MLMLLVSLSCPQEFVPILCHVPAPHEINLPHAGGAYSEVVNPAASGGVVCPSPPVVLRKAAQVGGPRAVGRVERLGDPYVNGFRRADGNGGCRREVAQLARLVIPTTGGGIGESRNGEFSLAGEEVVAGLIAVPVLHLTQRPVPGRQRSRWQNGATRQ